MAEVGILIIDDDIVSQRALKNVLDSEGWRVRIVPLVSAAMLELASGQWSLVIVNVAMTDVRGPLFNILKDLAQGDADALEGDADAPEGAEVDAARPKRIRVLFLVPLCSLPAMPSRSSKRKASPICSSHTICMTSWKKSANSSSKQACSPTPSAAWAIFRPPIENAAASAPRNAASAVPCSPPATITKCPKKNSWNGNAPKKKNARNAKRNSKTANTCSSRVGCQQSRKAPVTMSIPAAGIPAQHPSKILQGIAAPSFSL